MALEEQIVSWSKDRPIWQREVMRRTAEGAAFSEEDYDALVEFILQPPGATTGVSLGPQHLPEVSSEDPPVRILAISGHKHVNALASDHPLTFGPAGLTIVYGDNGSGKSGYARLLKRITRARHQEEVLSDVFRDTTLNKPTATLDVLIGEKAKELTWPEASSAELQRMRFYDSACGNAYVATDSDFPYRPSALAVMDGLISACVAVRGRIDNKLAENASRIVTLPVVPELLLDSDVGRYLQRLSGSSSIDRLDAMIATIGDANVTIDELKSEEARLRSNDSSKERQRLTRCAEKLEGLHQHLKQIHIMLGDDGLKALEDCRQQLRILQEAADKLAQYFVSEPLPGVGSTPWKVLWESARRFSEEGAYPGQSFPVVDADSRCVLCQDTLGEKARDRLSRFERFVKDDTQVRLDEARHVYEKRVDGFKKLQPLPAAVDSDQKDLAATHATLIVETRALIEKYSSAWSKTIEALESNASLALPNIDPHETLTALTQAATAARELSAGLADPSVLSGRLAAITTRRQKLELMQAAEYARTAIIKEIERRKEREGLEVAKAAAATAPITKKVIELSEASITEIVQDAFTREAKRLRLERVTIVRTKADKGALRHQPKLMGAQQDVKLPRVFSEGERTALGLVAFFTEAALDSSKSALILDDPVTSLDHIRRGLVATRIAEFAENRQVILFTHDVAFVAELKREAGEKGVPVAERSVTRSRLDERKPGSCTMMHPWKAKDVSARLEELGQDLKRISKCCESWSEDEYGNAVALWAGNLSETWERIISQEIVGALLAEGGLEVRPKMVKVLARFSDTDHREFNASYSRTTQWLKRHDKGGLVNFVPPDVPALEGELALVEAWFKRVKGYRA